MINPVFPVRISHLLWLFFTLVVTGCDGGAAISTAANTNEASTSEASTNTAANPANQPATMRTDQQPATQQPTTQPPAAVPTVNQQTQSTPPAQSTANPTVADITDLILVTGQSNALGAQTDFDPQLDQPDSRTFAFTEDGWRVANLNQVWDQGWFPRGNPNSDPSNNFSLHFGKHVTGNSNRVVGFVLVTAPGQAISHWNANGSFFNDIRNRVSRAINELPSKSQIDGILWHQGESDGRDDPAYGQALYAVIESFRSESWFEANRPFICGETASLPVNRQLNRLNTDNDPHTACIRGEGLETRGDGAHFTANALRTLGRRYGSQYLEMTR